MGTVHRPQSHIMTQAQWTLSQAAQFLGSPTTDAAYRMLHRYKIKPVARETGRGGQNLYDANQVQQVAQQRPGRGIGGGRPRTKPDETKTKES
ncbi:MAG: hypothetical protein ACREQ5_00660 [Candidatus Dormibacteria bacterium]